MPPLLASFFLVLRGQEENVCTDLPFKNGTVWTDHLLRPCSFYTENPSTRCAQNTTAKRMCCACGGGTTTAKSAPQAPLASNTIPEGCYDLSVNGAPWADSEGYTCAKYIEEDGWCSAYGDDYENDGLTADEACCVCGGGTVPNCYDLTANGMHWTDSQGYTCIDYSDDNSRCDAFGHMYENDGMTANVACCPCGGGCIDKRSNGNDWVDSLGNTCFDYLSLGSEDLYQH